MVQECKLREQERDTQMAAYLDKEAYGKDKNALFIASHEELQVRTQALLCTGSWLCSVCDSAVNSAALLAAVLLCCRCCPRLW